MIMKNTLWITGFVFLTFILGSCSGKIDCEMVEYNQNKGSWVNKESGKLAEGVCISRYDNGNIKEKKEFRSGNRFGTWEQFYSNGQLEKQWNYEDGFIPNAVGYYENGNKMFEHLLAAGYELPNDHIAFWSLKGWYKDGSIAYDLKPIDDNPIVFFKNPVFVKQNIITDFIPANLYERNIINAKGFVYYEDGDWATEFFDGSLKIELYNMKMELDTFTLHSISKNIELRSSNYQTTDIRYINYYNDIYIYPNTLLTVSQEDIIVNSTMSNFAGTSNAKNLNEAIEQWNYLKENSLFSSGRTMRLLD